MNYEIDLYERYGEYYGCMFFICKKTGNITSE